MKTILVTGGAGYIGSHTVLLLLEQNYRVVVIDNFSNSSKESIRRVEELTHRSVVMYPYDCLDKEKFEQVFKENKIDAVIHFAGLKAVGESVLKPLSYYQNNLISMLNLLSLMQTYQVKNLIFLPRLRFTAIRKAYRFTRISICMCPIRMAGLN